MYKIDRKKLKKEKDFYRMFFLAGLFFFGIFNFLIIFSITVDSEVNSMDNPIMALIFIWIFTGFFMKIGIDGMKKTDEKNNKYDYLEKHGKLVKGLKYTMMPTGKSVNDTPIYRIVAEYELETGAKVQLLGDGRFDRRFSDEDGLVDALIDPYDVENYFFDFNIEDSFDYDNTYSFENNNPIK